MEPMAPMDPWAPTDPWVPMDPWAPMDPRALWTHGPLDPGPFERETKATIIVIKTLVGFLAEVWKSEIQQERSIFRR